MIRRYGENLRHDLFNLSISRQPIISEWFYDRDIFMLTAGPGMGKSITGLQSSACMSSAVPVFGTMAVTAPKRVYYLQLEGDYEESIERLRVMEREGGIPINEKNLLIHETKDLDVLDKGSIKDFLTGMAEISATFTPDVFVVDPIYKLASDDYSKGPVARAIVTFLDSVQTHFNTSNFLLNHTQKSTYEIIEGKRVDKDDAYYGHSFLKNHIRTHYVMKKGKDDYERVLTRTKGRGSDTVKTLRLSYDEESMTLESDDKEVCKFEKVRKYLSRLKASGTKQTTFRQIANDCNVSDGHLKRVKKQLETEGIIKDVPLDGRTKGWGIL